MDKRMQRDGSSRLGVTVSCIDDGTDRLVVARATMAFLAPLARFDAAGTT